MLLSQMLQANKRRLTVNVLPDLHLWQVEGSTNNSCAQVAAPAPKGRDGPCSAAVSWLVGQRAGLWACCRCCAHNSGDTCI